MTKNKKIILIIVSCVLAVALLTLSIVLIALNSKREKTETTIMTCSVNPTIQFVLNGNDKVMEVVAINSDGQEISVNGDFVGLKADKAVELFVKLSTESGYIDVDTTGTKLEINFAGLKEDYTSLKNKVVEKANRYFDDNGIIAGAVAKVDEDIKQAIYTLKETATNLEDKTNEQLIEHYMNITELIKDVKASELAAFYAGYDEAVRVYNQAIVEIEEAVAELQEQLSAATDTTIIANLQQRIDNLLETEKTKALNIYNIAVSNLYKLQKATEDDINNFVTNFNQKVQDTKASIDTHKAEFNTNRAEVEQKIADYRNSLNA